MKHSIVCVMGCTGEWCDCPCHDEEPEGEPVGRVERASVECGTMAVATKRPPDNGASTPAGGPRHDTVCEEQRRD